MRITEEERRALVNVIEAGDRFGYGNLITHLQTAWAQRLIAEHGLSEAAARRAAGGAGMPFKMQDDLIVRGEWDETGARYRKPRRKRAAQ